MKYIEAARVDCKDRRKKEEKQLDENHIERF